MPFQIRIPFMAILEVVNSFSFYLAWKLLISSSCEMVTLLGREFLVACFFVCLFVFSPFSTLNVPLPSICKVAAEKSAYRLLEFNLYITNWFYFSAFRNLSLFLTFTILITAYLDMCVIEFILFGTGLSGTKHLFPSSD